MGDHHLAFWGFKIRIWAIWWLACFGWGHAVKGPKGLVAVFGTCRAPRHPLHLSHMAPHAPAKTRHVQARCVSGVGAKSSNPSMAHVDSAAVAAQTCDPQRPPGLLLVVLASTCQIIFSTM